MNIAEIFRQRLMQPASPLVVSPQAISEVVDLKTTEFKVYGKVPNPRLLKAEDTSGNVVLVAVRNASYYRLGEVLIANWSGERWVEVKPRSAPKFEAN